VFARRDFDVTRFPAREFAGRTRKIDRKVARVVKRARRKIQETAEPEKMKIVEIKTEADFDYKNFFLEGLRAHEESFRISPRDELNAPFPTRGTPDSFTLGAVSVDDELLGVVSFEREGATREKLRHKGLLFRMYVARHASGQGIGKILIREIIDRARQIADIEQINLTVIAANERARGIYAAFGFETFSIEKRAIKYNGKYFDEETMVLFL
jgi:RimJ/RimL family protein N-acetyltransferase